MKKYYFTFNENHYNKDGISMKPYWVQVDGNNYDHARGLFLQHFMVPHMQSFADFSHQFHEEEFVKVKGCFEGGLYKAVK